MIESYNLFINLLLIMPQSRDIKELIIQPYVS
jgi:hypothetical protein